MRSSIDFQRGTTYKEQSTRNKTQSTYRVNKILLPISYERTPSIVQIKHVLLLQMRFYRSQNIPMRTYTRLQNQSQSLRCVFPIILVGKLPFFSRLRSLPPMHHLHNLRR